MAGGASPGGVGESVETDIAVAPGLPVGGPAALVAGVRERLARVDVERMGDRERVDLISELERLKGTASATQARATHALRESREDAQRESREEKARQDAVRSVGSEVALARRESPSLGDRFVGLSRALVTELPETMRALTAGVIGERHAIEVVQQSATLTVEDRAELDRRVAPILGHRGVAAVGRAARRVAAELDAAAVVRRMEQAARSRRVTVRPAPDGMAYLTVLAPLPEVVGAYAALRRRATAVVGGQCPEEAPGGRGSGAVMADTATRLLSGRAAGQTQPIEVHLVMTDRALLGAGGASRLPMEPARIPGHGSLPAPVARAWVRGADEGSVWLRRLFTPPDGRDLVAMDSRRRVFSGLLRRMLVLRDDVCSTPWCDGAIVHADHTTPVRDRGPTELGNGSGTCARCNHVKEAPGWSVSVVHPGVWTTSVTSVPHSPTVSVVGAESRAGPVAGAGPPASDHRPREIEVVTPTGHRHRSQAPPLLGWGWEPRPARSGDATRSDTEGDTAAADTASVLERELERLLEAVA